MSVIKMADLSCDFCKTRVPSTDEYRSNDYGRCPTGGLTTRLRAKARQQGWDRVKRPRGLVDYDRCAECKAQGRTEVVR